MAKGPKGEKRPADFNKRAFAIVQIASGEAEEASQSASQAKAGKARREGATWFFVPPTAEKKNPGVGAPGSNDVFE